MTSQEPLINHAAKGVPYYLPEQGLRIGSAFKNVENVPKLFTPLKLRGIELTNRLGVSPMCQYSAHEGVATPYHFVHYSDLALRGPGVIIIEASSVVPNGRLSPEDLGIWTDEQALELKKIVDFAHANKQTIGIQIAHGGRKASAAAMWLAVERLVQSEEGGWPNNVDAPSSVAHSDQLAVPKALTVPEIKEIVQAFADAAKRAIEIAGFDFVEIHGAHGYLIDEFLSPHANHRTDEYGGSFENRTRFLLEIVDSVRKVLPETAPLWLRMSTDDNVGDQVPAWTLKDTIELAPILVEHGLDVLDVSSGGVNNHAQRRGRKDAFHEHLAGPIKKAVGDKLTIAIVGGIHDGKTAERLLEENKADIVLVGRGFQKNPGLVYQFADELGVKVHYAVQQEWGFYGQRSNPNFYASR